MKTVQAKDVPEDQVLRLLARTRIMEGTWTLNYQVAETFPEFPPKVLLAKMRALKRRGLVTWCGCGCRGDWDLTAAGLATIDTLERPDP